MTIVLVVVGAICVVTVVVDLLWTTVAASAGGGPVTTRLISLLWSAVTRWRSHRWLLQVTGVVITLSVVVTWMVVLVVGWYLIFSASPDAVVKATTGAPADAWSRLYFVGYTIFTLGTGDFVPGGAVWQVLTVPATATGLSLITLAITYLLSVTDSVTQRRSLAAQISALGLSPAEILRRAWNGVQLEGLASALQSLTPGLSQLAQRHLAFPVLHYFHSTDRVAAVAPSVAVLDELITVLEHRVAPDHRTPRADNAPGQGRDHAVVEASLGGRTDALWCIGGHAAEPAVRGAARDRHPLDRGQTMAGRGRQVELSAAGAP